MFYQEAFDDLGKNQVYFVFADNIELARRMMAPLKAAGYQLRFIEENVIMSLRRECVHVWPDPACSTEAAYPNAPRNVYCSSLGSY